MVFFLGKDVTIAVQTEKGNDYGVSVLPAGGGATQVEFPADGSISAGAETFALAGSGTVGKVQPQITAVDVSIGAMDEDISYFGMRSVTKAEIKKETTITITRKKTSEMYDVLFNEVRFGVTGAAALDGLEMPTVTKGYRIFVSMDGEQGTDEVITIKGCCITGHSVTMGVDGTMDETLELMSYITPDFATGKDATAITTDL
tara:strand:+ start:959 stop:1564 length:606 start_codon:yes stop_codon:yes gene_type:complete